MVAKRKPKRNQISLLKEANSKLRQEYNDLIFICECFYDSITAYRAAPNSADLDKLLARMDLACRQWEECGEG